MSVKIKAHELARAIKESKEWSRVDKARAEVEKHEAAKIMLRDLNAIQMKLYQKQMMGQEPNEDEINEVKRISETVSFNPYVRELLEAEYEFGNMMAEVQDILGDALGLKQGEEDSQPVAEPEKPAKSKLWTPR